MLPGLSAVYGLRWVDVWAMPRRELQEYLEQMPQWVKVLSAGMLDVK